MKNYIFVILSIFLISNCFAGKVVFLRGSGCSGKTSLCNELVQKSNKWKLVNEDEIFYKAAAERWKNEFPKEFEIIEQAIDNENVLHAVMRNQILFRENTSDNIRVEAKLAIGSIQEQLNNRPRNNERDNPNSWSNTLRKKITQTIIDLAKNNHVIVDTWFLQKEHIKEISEQYEVMHVVAYCPFLDIIKRTMQRNYCALMDGKNISNLRFFHQALNSFTGLYDISEVKDNSLDDLKKESVIHGCDLVSLCLEDSPKAIGSEKPFTRGEFSLKEFESYRKNLLEKFKGETAYVHPKHKMDKVIRTDKESPQGCAKELNKLVNN